MAVREIVAWVMVALFGAAGAFCLVSILGAGFTAPPQNSVIAAAVVTVTGVVVLEIALAMVFPKQSGAPPDERERFCRSLARITASAPWPAWPTA